MVLITTGSPAAPCTEIGLGQGLRERVLDTQGVLIESKLSPGGTSCKWCFGSPRLPLKPGSCGSHEWCRQEWVGTAAGLTCTQVLKTLKSVNGSP